MASSGNFAKINFEAQSLISTVTPTLGGLKFDGSTLSPSNYNGGVVCNFGMKGGKWYWEIYLSGGGTPIGARDWSVGFAPYSTCSKTTDEGTYGQDLGNGSSATLSGYSFSHVNASATGIRHNNSTDTSAGLADHTSGDVLGFALDLDNGTWIIYRNGTSLGTVATGIDTSLTYFAAVGASGGTVSDFDVTCNFGQDSTFGGAISAGGNADGNGFGDFKYSVPSGYLACCTGNLEISTDIDPAQTDDDYPSKQFGVVTYTGNATTGQAITGMGCQPDLVWAKCRSHAQSNFLSDTSRGINKFLFSDQIAAEASGGGYASVYSSFDSDGFTLGTSGSGPNDSGRTYVAWGWRANGGTTATNNDGNVTTTVQANAKAGFSIVTWTGTASNSRTLGTGLSKQAELVFVKNRDNSSYTTVVYHHNMKNGGLPNDYGILQLHGTNAYSEGSGALTYWDISEWSNSVFSVGGDVGINGSGNNMLAYCWHGVEGYSKFGYYKGNYATDGTFIYTGFRPRMLFVKRSDAANSWFVWDTERTTYNKMNSYLYWDLSNAEETGYAIDALSNGFKIRGQNNATNNNGGFFIYGAWGDVPFKYGNTF